MSRFKKCFKCQAVKPIEEFYKHPKMADGHLNKCKGCCKHDVKTHRDENLDRIRAYDRARAKTDSRIKHAVEVTRAWRQQDKRRHAAHSAVARAIKVAHWFGSLANLAATQSQSPTMTTTKSRWM